MNPSCRVQVHVFDHDFASDFHDLDMTVQICGFLRYGLLASHAKLQLHCSSLDRL